MRSAMLLAGPQLNVFSSSGSHTWRSLRQRMKWITRKDVKVDRVACPWLIKRFIDPQAEFLFVNEKDLVDQSKQQGAIPFDAPHAWNSGVRSGPAVPVPSVFTQLY